MRTTVDLEETLIERAKRLASGEGRTLGSVLNDALRAYLSGRRSVAKEPAFELIVRGTPGGRFPTPAELAGMLEDEDVAAIVPPPREPDATP